MPYISPNTTARNRLPDRRACVTFSFQCNALAYSATVSHYPDGDLAEIFISNSKAGSHSDSAAKDSAVVCSIALQHGISVDVIRRALLRDPRGKPSSLGVALDLIAGEAMTLTSPFQAKPSNGYLKLDHSFLKSSAWQSLQALPAAVFLEIAGRHNGYNNGQIGYSVRDGMARFRVGDRAVRRAFSQLEASGFAVRTRTGAFDLKSREAKTTEWLVPSLRTPQRPAADTTTTSDPLPADTTTTSIDKRIESRWGKDSNFRSLAKKEEKPEGQKDSQAQRWIAEGKSPFTGCPTWKRTGYRPNGGNS